MVLLIVFLEDLLGLALLPVKVLLILDWEDLLLEFSLVLALCTRGLDGPTERVGEVEGLGLWLLVLLVEVSLAGGLFTPAEEALCPWAWTGCMVFSLAFNSSSSSNKHPSLLLLTTSITSKSSMLSSKFGKELFFDAKDARCCTTSIISNSSSDFSLEGRCADGVFPRDMVLLGEALVGLLLLEIDLLGMDLGAVFKLLVLVR